MNEATKARKKPAKAESGGSAIRVVVLHPGVDSMLRPSEVAAHIACSPRYLARLRATGIFPGPDTPATERPRWRVSTVNAYLDRRYPRGK